MSIQAIDDTIASIQAIDDTIIASIQAIDDQTPCYLYSWTGYPVNKAKCHTHCCTIISPTLTIVGIANICMLCPQEVVFWKHQTLDKSFNIRTMYRSPDLTKATLLIAEVIVDAWGKIWNHITPLLCALQGSSGVFYCRNCFCRMKLLDFYSCLPTVLHVQVFKHRKDRMPFASLMR